jgi:predicted alpha-1,2-mannosidase
MKIYLTILFVLILATFSPRPLFSKDNNTDKRPVDYVDPMIGTADSRWMLFPGATMPSGMVNLSPDNQNQGWKAGYEYTIENIAGFSHIHSWVMGGLLTMPTTGKLQTSPGDEKDPDSGYRSRFSHNTEEASPGYYAVTLDDYQIRAEMTATKRTGFQRYTFPQSDNSRILFDLTIPTEYGYRQYDTKIEKLSDREIVGHSTQMGQGINCRLQNDYTIYFVVKLSKPFKTIGAWERNWGETEDTRLPKNQEIYYGNGDFGAYVEFSTQEGEVVLMKTGISLVSVEQARLNLEKESEEPFGWDFDACKAHGEEVWNNLLSRLMVEGSEADKRKFYTNMYRSYTARADYTDVNGMYRDMNEKVQIMNDTNNGVYGCDALWTSFWNLNQLWNLATPDLSNKWVNSMLEIYDRGGWLPKGPTGVEYSGIMVASHSIPFIVAAYQHGIRNFDTEKAFRAMYKQQTVPGQNHEGGGFVGNRQLEPYLKYGYVPVEAGWRWSEAATSNTLEYAYDDWCVAQMAKMLDRKSDFNYFMNRGQYYRNMFDPETKFMRPRYIDGSWMENFDELNRSTWFCEATSWQYTWFVPHDLYGLMDLLGEDLFNERLEKGMIESRKKKFYHFYLVNVGNQPNMQAAWLFNYSGKPWLTQKYSRLMVQEYFGDNPYNGWPGDEDQGQMGSWFVMNAMGLFQMDGGCRENPIYEIGSPLFDHIEIALDPKYYPGGTFVIETRNNSPENYYIQKAFLNGKELKQCWIYAHELQAGGKLVLEMGPEPNKQWGIGHENRPPDPNK